MNKKSSSIDFKTKSTELDELLIKLQDTDIPVDEATKYYQQGIEIIRELEDYLESAQNKVRKITDASG